MARSHTGRPGAAKSKSMIARALPSRNTTFSWHTSLWHSSGPPCGSASSVDQGALASNGTPAAAAWYFRSSVPTDARIGSSSAHVGERVDRHLAGHELELLDPVDHRAGGDRRLDEPLGPQAAQERVERRPARRRRPQHGVTPAEHGTGVRHAPAERLVVAHVAESGMGPLPAPELGRCGGPRKASMPSAMSAVALTSSW